MNATGPATTRTELLLRDLEGLCAELRQLRYDRDANRKLIAKQAEQIRAARTRIRNLMKRGRR